MVFVGAAERRQIKQTGMVFVGGAERRQTKQVDNMFCCIFDLNFRSVCTVSAYVFYHNNQPMSQWIFSCR